MLQFPYGVVSILGPVLLKEKIEISSIWERDLDLLEELEEKEMEAEYRLDWPESYQKFSTENGFEVTLGWPELFFPHGCGFLPDIPPEVFFFS